MIRNTSRPAQSLFNARVLARISAASAIMPTPEQRTAATDWAQRARDPLIVRIKEEAIRSLFTERIIQQVLGYIPVHPSLPFTMAEEEPIGAGSVDRALGRFSPMKREIFAPFELKGPKTKDLDAIMPGRAKSPVQQAWEYAIDAPGARWVMISNCVQLRLYAFGKGRTSYEQWNLAELDQPGELERLILILSADNLLGNSTSDLLVESDRAEKKIGDDLYADYKKTRDKLINVIDDNNAGLGRAKSIEHAQTLLDRALFIAFAEDTELLPRETLKKAFQTQNPYSPQPVWGNFKGLFSWIDKGNAARNIPAYNGGLFAADASFDNIQVPDEACESLAKFGDYDFATEVSVLILGRIFEQSISDLEAMQALASGQPAPPASKQKREGVVYTPEFITRFIVEKVIGSTLRERFDMLLAEYSGTRSRDASGADVLSFLGRSKARNERAFWEAYQKVLKTFTVLDPACGSGAFLVAAFDFLAAEYRRVNDRLADLVGGTAGLFDPDKDILSGNLFGVDVSPESVEITKLSLWLKTARRGKPLESLESNIRVGNSLIEDSAYHHRSFTWRDAFPGVIDANGFDVVVGNPPYVRMELIKPFKAYLARRYEVVAERADLYAYFFELGMRYLKPGGRLGYISSSTFFRTGSGEPLRRFLAGRSMMETVVDFGDLQVFEGVTTYPAIAVMKKPQLATDGKPQPITGSLRFLNVQDEVPEELSRVFEQQSTVMPRERLGAEEWQFESDERASLRSKLRAGYPTLKDVYGSPLYGIKTGLNDAFVVNRKTRDQLAIDDLHAQLMVPFLRGEDIKRWRVESEELWLINIPRDQINIDDFPALKAHLEGFKTKLEARATRQGWFELQQAQLAYQPHMRGPKIIYPHFGNVRSFASDTGSFSNDKTYFIPNGDNFLLGLLNSKAMWFVFCGFSPAVRGGWREHRVQYIEKLPIPPVAQVARDRIAASAQAASTAAHQRLLVERAVHRRIPDLCPSGHVAKMTGKLSDWWKLDFVDFAKEIKKVYKLDMSLKQKDEWQDYLDEKKKSHRDLSKIISDSEKSIDVTVNEIFGLSEHQINLLS